MKLPDIYKLNTKYKHGSVLLMKNKIQYVFYVNNRVS